MTADAQRALGARLQAGQVPLISALEARGLPVLTRFHRVLHGVMTRVPEERLRDGSLLALPGVVAVSRATELTAELDASLVHTGVALIRERLDVDGAGVDIGVIDSGVDYTHAALGGPGVAGVPNDPATVQDMWGGLPLFPNAKVVGGWDFVGDAYDLDDDTLPVADPDPFPPLDADEDHGVRTHGTHVAATAAGLAHEGGSAGVAPGARVWALKVIGEGGTTTMTAAAIEWAADPDGDSVVDDALDVLNISLGSAFAGGGDSETVVEIQAVDAFVALGGVVVCSAGNRGDKPFVVSAPGAARTAISVANTYPPGEVRASLTVAQPDALAGAVPATLASPALAPAPLSATGGLLVAAGDACAPLAPGGLLEGAIALVSDGGGCSHAAKLGQVEAAGAVGALVVRAAGAGDPVVMTGGPAVGIPAAMLAWSDGKPFIDALVPSVSAGSGEGAEWPVAANEVKVVFGAELASPELVDALRHSSSRGPAVPDREALLADRVVSKPDLAAPGTGILAAAAGSGTEVLAKTGTSMATPHVAGVAALLRQARPALSPLGVKAALMVTATPWVWEKGDPELTDEGRPATHSRRGAGRVDARAALEREVIAWHGDTVTVDLGLQLLRAPTTLTRTVAIHRLGEPGGPAQPQTLTVELAGVLPAGAVVATVAPKAISLAPGETEEVALTLTLDPAPLQAWRATLDQSSLDDTLGDPGRALEAVELSGALVVTPAAGGAPVRVPVHGLLRAGADLDVVDGCLHASKGALGLAVEGERPLGAELFTLLSEDPDEPEGWQAADVAAVGVRFVDTASDPEIAEALGGAGLQVALWTRDTAVLPARVRHAVWLDHTGDGRADHLLATLGEGWRDGASANGRTVAVAFEAASGGGEGVLSHLGSLWRPVGEHPVLAGVMGRTQILSLTWSDLDLPGPPAVLGMWTATFDPAVGTTDPLLAVDVVPDATDTAHIIWQKEPIELVPGCGTWRFERAGALLMPEPSADAGLARVGEDPPVTALPVLGAPSCPLDPSGAVLPRGVLVLTDELPDRPQARVLAPTPPPEDAACLDALVVEANAPSCRAELQPSALLDVPTDVAACYGDLTPAGALETPLALGEHDVAVTLEDGWRRVWSCSTRVEVVDTRAPALACPWDIELDPDAEGAVIRFDVDEPCGLAVGLTEVDGARGVVTLGEPGVGQATASVVLTLRDYEPGVESVTVGFQLEDALGHVAFQTCELPMAGAVGTNPGGALAGGGCAGGRSSHDLGWPLALMVSALWLARRGRGVEAPR